MTAGSGDASLPGREESPDSIEQQCRVTPAGATLGTAPQRTDRLLYGGKGETVG